MTQAAASRLYNAGVLALATDLAAYPLDPSLPCRAEARSRTCGSTIRLGVALAQDGSVARIGMQVSACAIGQASAALLARGAPGRWPHEIAQTRSALAAWLEGSGALPDWPGLAALEAARGHPGRHDALMLAWTTAQSALSTLAQPR